MSMIEDEATQLSASGMPHETTGVQVPAAQGPGGLRASLDALQARLAIPARYEVLAELGRGGMGIVYKVRDIETCEVVALKILKPEIAADPAMWETLRKEVCLARKVTHKNVCRIHEFSRSETTACISMEYVDGESLLSKLQRRGALQAADAIEIARQICAGLREAHEQGIVHRDLKPANIVVAGDKTVKIMDFGVARQARETYQTTGTLAGTPAYMSPEQLEMRLISARTDIYALGIMLYEMVTGEPAFRGESAIALALQQIRQVPRRPSEIMPTVPARLDAAILKCLEKDPAKRFSSVDELSLALEKSISTASAPGKPLIDVEPAKIALRKVGRAAWADLDLLGKNIQTGARQIERVARPYVKKCIATLLALNWRMRPSRNVQAVTFGAAILSAALVFGLVMRQQTHAAQPTPAAHASVVVAGSGASLVPAATPEPVSPFNAKEFEFDPANSSADSAGQTDHDASNRSAAAVVPAKIAQAPHAALATTAKKSKPSHSIVQAADPQIGTASAATSDAASLAAAQTDELPLSGHRDISSALVSLQPAATAANKADSASPAPNASASYLEVGSFNDASWADDAVKQLSGLGFAALCVHKSHLWVQSYHVEVGPFKAAGELEAAEKRLTAKGFRSHPVK
jgi:serine/threonine protein kinase/cell division protein FtsN